ncbi:spermidine synthase [Nostocoides australiense]
MSVRFERDERGGVTVWVHGHPQSYVAPHDPGLLAFEYVEQLGAVVDSIAPEGDRIAVTHVGGAGLTLPRYVEFTRPGSTQIVFEPDAVLTEHVRRELPLPRGHRIRVRPLDGRAGLSAVSDASADLVVVDAFSDGAVPAELTTVEFYREALRVLRPDGLLAANVTDALDRRYLVRVLAGVLEMASACVVLATHDVLKGRRFGNYVIVAGQGPLPLRELSRRVAKTAAPAGMWLPARVSALSRSARPSTDADPARCPPAPDPGSWRVR